VRLGHEGHRPMGAPRSHQGHHMTTHGIIRPSKRQVAHVTGRHAHTRPHKQIDGFLELGKEEGVLTCEEQHNPERVRHASMHQFGHMLGTAKAVVDPALIVVV
jgi:hypothetical protein